MDLRRATVAAQAIPARGEARWMTYVGEESWQRSNENIVRQADSLFDLPASIPAAPPSVTKMEKP